MPPATWPELGKVRNGPASRPTSRFGYRHHAANVNQSWMLDVGERNPLILEGIDAMSCPVFAINDARFATSPFGTADPLSFFFFFFKLLIEKKKQACKEKALAAQARHESGVLCHHFPTLPIF
jgi:hypothetical protein